MKKLNISKFKVKLYNKYYSVSIKSFKQFICYRSKFETTQTAIAIDCLFLFTIFPLFTLEREKKSILKAIEFFADDLMPSTAEEREKADVSERKKKSFFDFFWIAQKGRSPLKPVLHQSPFPST